MSSAADVRPDDDRGTPTGADRPGTSRLPLMVVGWVWVAVPFGYGVWRLLERVSNLFSG